jgi:F-type H+-transporting ATPase subunit alpha
VQNGFFDDVPVEKVKDFQTKLTDYLQNRKLDLIGRITKEKAMSDPIVADLKAAVTEFKQTYR